EFERQSYYVTRRHAASVGASNTHSARLGSFQSPAGGALKFQHVPIPSPFVGWWFFLCCLRSPKSRPSASSGGLRRLRQQCAKRRTQPGGTARSRTPRSRTAPNRNGTPGLGIGSVAGSS